MARFTFLDYSVVFIYLVATVAIGLYFSKRQKTVEDYFVAGRSAPTWAVAISAIATGLSAISYLGVPACVYENDMQLNAAIILLPFSMLLVIYLFVPVLARMRLLTIYEYLEQRFDVATRSVASALFLILRGGWLAIGIFAQSALLATISGIPLWTCIAIVGVLTAAYTVFGGLEAVIWTDVMQFFVSGGGLIVILGVVIYAFHGDVGKIWSIAEAGGHTKVVDTGISLTRVTVWGLIIFTLVDNLATYGSDQIMVQRFLATSDSASMRRSILLTGLMTVPVVALLVAVGLALAAYYNARPDLQATLGTPSNLVPHFIANVLPSGLAGLVIAGVFAETMSTLSSGFNSLATATTVDFVYRFRKRAQANEAAEVRLAKGITIIWATVSTLGAGVLAVTRGQEQIVATFLSLSSFFTGPILGVFLLGILFSRPGGPAALSGIVLGTLATWAVSLTPIHWLWYSPVGCSVTVIVGVALGMWFPRRIAAPITHATDPLSVQDTVVPAVVTQV